MDREHSNGVLRVSIMSGLPSPTAFADKDSRHPWSLEFHDSCETPHMSFVRTRAPLKNHRGHNVLTADGCLGKTHHKSEIEVLLILDAHHLHGRFAQKSRGFITCSHHLYPSRLPSQSRSSAPLRQPKGHPHCALKHRVSS
jgi:hypothetical protein